MDIINYDKKQNKMLILDSDGKVYEEDCKIIKIGRPIILIGFFILGIITGLNTGWYLWKADKNLVSGIQNEIEELNIKNSYIKRPQFVGPVKPIYFIKIFNWSGGEEINKEKLSETIYAIMRKLKINENKDFHDLIMETCAVETDFGFIVKQTKGPALSIYQILPSTFRYILNDIKKKDKNQYKRIMNLYDNRYGDTYNYIYNVPFTTAICMMYYVNTVKNLEDKIKTRTDRAKVWKKYYNTEGGKGTVDIYLKRTNDHI